MLVDWFLSTAFCHGRYEKELGTWYGMTGGGASVDCRKPLESLCERNDGPAVGRRKESCGQSETLHH